MKPRQSPARRPDVRLDDDGCAWLCLDCGASVFRTRMNPYPPVPHKPACEERRAERRYRKILPRMIEAGGAMALAGVKEKEQAERRQRRRKP